MATQTKTFAVRPKIEDRAKEISLAETIRLADLEVNSFVEVFDSPLPKEKTMGPLHGLTYAVKEIIDQKGLASPWGVDFLHDRTGLETATCVNDLDRAGARRVGTTRSTLMAIVGDSGTRNPRDTRRSPGGSSAGSAAAVAAGMVDFALGTQTVGSIIRPASYCGVPSFKPTFGRLSTQGVMPLAEELDHVGLIARDVGTIRSVMRELTVLDSSTEALREILVPATWFDEKIHPCVHAAIHLASRTLERLGLEVRPFEIPEDIVKNEALILTGILHKGIHDNHSAFIRANANRLPAELVEFERLGGLMSDGDLAVLRDQQSQMKMMMSELVPNGAALLCPSVIDVPPRLGQGTGLRQPQRLWTLLGWPAFGIPVGTYKGNLKHLSVSVQLVGRSGEDAALLDLSEILESRIRPVVPVRENLVETGRAVG